jgi:hypothetical protein
VTYGQLIFFTVASLCLASCTGGADDAGDKYQYDMGRIIEHAPRISDDEAQGQKLGGAEAVLLSVPNARKDVQDAWFLGTGLAWTARVPGLGESRSDAEIALGPIRQGLCWVNAGEMHVRADHVCGYGSYLKPEGRWLANNIAPLSLDTSRDFILDELDTAERHACEVMEDYRQMYPNDRIQHPELFGKCNLVFKNRPRNLIVRNGH